MCSYEGTLSHYSVLPNLGSWSIFFFLMPSKFKFCLWFFQYEQSSHFITHPLFLDSHGHPNKALESQSTESHFISCNQTPPVFLFNAWAWGHSWRWSRAQEMEEVKWWRITWIAMITLNFYTIFLFLWFFLPKLT